MHLPPSLAKFQSGAALPKAELNVQLEALEQATLARALAEESGNRTRAARRLGISRRALIYKIEKFGL
jgi:DNA-binding NtrC family response regulator